MDDRGRAARDTDVEDDASAPYVSTGHLPRDERVRDAVAACHRELVGVRDGTVSDVYPALAQADPSWFGIAVLGVDGHEFVAGDVDVPFALMSVAKPFVFALACARLGVDAVVDHIGVDATGRAFNSLAAVESSPDGRTNPMVNPGAIACTGLLLAPGHDDAGGVDDAWDELRAGLSAFAGRDLELDDAVHESARTSNQRNRAIGQLLHSLGRLGDPDGAVDLYTRQSSLAVTARDLAVMGATLADGGINPVTGYAVVSPRVAARTLAVMATAGLYETSGEWLVRVGLPGKSGIGGGIVTAAPGKGGLGTFSPPLDAAGNSVRGVRAAARLSRSLGLDLFGSAAVTPERGDRGR
ncbi:MAG TPA: glutaminase A [Actinotalea sp.]|nr:glutaminase A [Actinotalea sp.]